MRADREQQEAQCSDQQPQGRLLFEARSYRTTYHLIRRLKRAFVWADEMATAAIAPTTSGAAPPTPWQDA
jgi:hypothetical protein